VGKDSLQLGFTSCTAGRDGLATVVSIERPTAGLLERFLTNRATEKFNHPFVGSTSLTNDLVCAFACAWDGSTHVTAIAGVNRAFHLAQFTSVHIHAGGARGMDGARVWRCGGLRSRVL